VEHQKLSCPEGQRGGWCTSGISWVLFYEDSPVPQAKASVIHFSLAGEVFMKILSIDVSPRI
jgi:hypothetical protein